MKEHLKNCLKQEIIVLCINKGNVKCVSGTLNKLRSSSLELAFKENIDSNQGQKWIESYHNIPYSEIEKISTGKKVLHY